MSSCLSDIGYTTGETMRATAQTAAALLRSAAMTVIAIDNANQAVKNFKKQWKIAKRELTMAQERQGQLETVFWPRELQMLNEFATSPPHDGVEVIESVETLGRRYSGRIVSAVAARFAAMLSELRTTAPRYNTSDYRKKLQDMHLSRAAAVASARTLGRNIAWAEVMAREETDWNRRKSVAALGRGLLAQAAALMQQAGASYGALGNAALSGLEGALKGAFQSFKEAQDSGVPIKKDATYTGYNPKGNVRERSAALAAEVGLKGTESLMQDAKVGTEHFAWPGGGSDHWNGNLTTETSIRASDDHYSKNNMPDT